VGDAAAVAVTVEPEGGSPQPTTAPFIVAKVAKI
jgi:anti-sigma-K factor RskA